MAQSDGKAPAKAQASNVTFELHTLGWEAFQNLCGHVAREILGQTVTLFSATNDVGQDGAFQGTWKRTEKEVFTGRFVLQCKFTSLRDKHLALGDLKDELTKAEALAKADHANTYILITNAKVSGEAAVAIRKAFSEISALSAFELFGSEWLTQEILTSKRLRAFVPRIYGLGDLTQILDERVYRQAQEILVSWKDNLSKFVPTQAHMESVRALLDKGFVLLLGDPMAGKSTIAAALALASADEGCMPVFVSHPSQFRSHWNPDEPKQFFWVDDAFGQTQFNLALAAEWNSVFPLLVGAIRHGARVLFTSRTYIYKQAESVLKSSAFPALRDAQVVIRVEQLTILEKERILYNHMRLGGQPHAFRAKIKPYLSIVATNPSFFPEVARRLADPFFTQELKIEADPLRRFVEEPMEVLREIINQLDRPSFAALALLFMRSGRVSIPPRIDALETESMNLLGASVAEIRNANAAMEGSLVAHAIEDGSHFWKFRHPSIRDAFAKDVAARPDLIDVYLGGVKAIDLMNEVLCGNIQYGGAHVHVPTDRFDRVISKICPIDVGDWWNRFKVLGFLVERCDASFLTRWLKGCPDQLDRLFSITYIGDYKLATILARLQDAGALSESRRAEYVARVMQAATEDAETTFLTEELRCLITEGELAAVINAMKTDLLPRLEDMILRQEDKYNSADDDPTDHFSELRSNLEQFGELHDDPVITAAFQSGLRMIEEAVERIDKSNASLEAEKKRKEEEEADQRYEEEREYWEAIAEGGISPVRASSSPIPPRSNPLAADHIAPRNIFDDVDAE
jgi:hypothetical protein